MFSPEALQSLNATYEARLLSKRELKRRAGSEYDAKHALESGEPAYEVDGEILTEDQLQEQYLTCEFCQRLVYSEPLTWGVMQWHFLDDEVHCNECYRKAVMEQIESGEHATWPVSGELNSLQFRNALDERIMRDALTTKWEAVYEGGGDSMSPSSTEYGGKSLQSTLHECQRIVANEPSKLFLVTVTQWQFCADVTLWRRS